MFKKPSEIRGQQRLSGADRKKLRRNIRDKFPGATDEQLDAILPPKADVAVTRLVNRVLVYGFENGLPMLFDCDGRGTEIYPTVFALWRVPDLVPSFLLKGGEVSRYVLSGADLMAPGVQMPAAGLPGFRPGEVWSVKVPGNSCPIAVGITMVGSAEAVKAGMRGKLLRITHYYRDSLWETAEGSYVPNKGFLADIVVPDPDAPAQASPEGQSTDPDTSPQHTLAAAAAAAAAEQAEEDYGAAVAAAASVSDSPQQLAEPLRQMGLDATGASAGGVGDSGAGDGEVGEQAAAAAQATPAQMDDLLDRCLLQALSVSIKPTHLPLGASSLWSNHVLPCRPPGTTVDIKRSSHKKLSKWLHAKAVDGLISGKEDKHRKEFILSAINYRHPALVAFTPDRTTKPAQPPPSATQDAASATPGTTPGTSTTTATTTTASSSSTSASSSSSSGELTVEEVFKPSHHVSAIFETVGLDPHGFYSPSAARDAALSYITLHSLTKPSDPSKVILDATLCDALYKGAIKKGTAYPTECHKREVGPTLVRRMQAHHRVERGGRSVVRKGGLVPVQILVERRQGNKKVTRVTGLEAYLVEAEPLAAELQKKFASSTSVTEVPGKKGQQEVLIQGGVLDELARLLVDVHGIPKSHIEVLDKTRR
ncbi:hypothetical protein CLOM_g16830 [Closterium sp. NIES-68]|nr:hypothetical protein CLOM_g16830 [Closterium sp. NIES-68]GJP75630.1 hypothetical protein CLOP_g6058 [Closterium sp. NIES-67]